MKSLFVCTMAMSLFISCRSKHETTFTSDDGKTSVSVDIAKSQDAAQEMSKKMEELKKIPPLKIEEIKAMLPEQLVGMKRNNFNATTAMGFASGDAEYSKDDTTTLKLTIFDCAGEAGSGFYALNYWTKMSMQSENNDGYTKTVDFMGGKAVEDYKKDNERYTLTFPANDRLMVILEGEHVSLGTLQDAAKALNVKVN